MSTGLGRFLLVLVTLFLVGCRAEFNEAQLIKQIRSKNPLVTLLQKRFPDLNVTLTETPVRKYESTRGFMVQAEGKLENAMSLIYQRTYEIDSHGDAIIEEGPPGGSAWLQRPGDKAASLSVDELERLVEVVDANAALAEIGIDFDRGPVDATKVVNELRQIDPQIEKVYALSRKTRTFIDVPPYRSQGTMTLTVPLEGTFELTAMWEVGLPKTDGSAKLSDDSEPTFLLSKSHSGEAAIKLTTENVDALLEATTPAQAAEAIWKRALSPERRGTKSKRD